MANKKKKENKGQFREGSQRAREMGKKGGLASSGSFKKGSDRAREAGRKGGRSSRVRH